VYRLEIFVTSSVVEWIQYIKTKLVMTVGVYIYEVLMSTKCKYQILINYNMYHIVSGVIIEPPYPHVCHER